MTTASCGIGATSGVTVVRTLNSKYPVLEDPEKGRALKGPRSVVKSPFGLFSLPPIYMPSKFTTQTYDLRFHKRRFIFSPAPWHSGTLKGGGGPQGSLNIHQTKMLLYTRPHPVNRTHKIRTK